MSDVAKPAAKKYDSFAEFYPFYLSEHSDQICRRLRVRNRATHEVRVSLDDYERVLRLPLPKSVSGELPV